MPSYLTDKLCEEGDTFEEFVWRAARVVGAFIHMRDDSLDTKLRLPEFGFHRTGTKEKIAEREADLEDEQDELLRLQGKEPAEIEASYERYKAKALRDYEEETQRVQPVYERITAMRAQVADWQPPTPEHEDFKLLLIRQLDEALDYDGRLPKRPQFEETAEEWHAKLIEYSERRVERCKELLEDERSKPDYQNVAVDWIRALVESVPPPPGRFANGELEKLRRLK